MGNAGLVEWASHLGVFEPVELFVGKGTGIHLLDIVSGSFQNREGDDVVEGRRGNQGKGNAAFRGKDNVVVFPVRNQSKLTGTVLKPGCRGADRGVLRGTEMEPGGVMSQLGYFPDVQYSCNAIGIPLKEDKTITVRIDSEGRVEWPVLGVVATILDVREIPARPYPTR